VPQVSGLIVADRGEQGAVSGERTAAHLARAASEPRGADQSLCPSPTTTTRALLSRDRIHPIHAIRTHSAASRSTCVRRLRRGRHVTMWSATSRVHAGRRAARSRRFGRPRCRMPAGGVTGPAVYPVSMSQADCERRSHTGDGHLLTRASPRHHVGCRACPLRAQGTRAPCPEQCREQTERRAVRAEDRRPSPRANELLTHELRERIGADAEQECFVAAAAIDAAERGRPATGAVVSPRSPT
jgi:hypothetical protein